LYPIIYLEIEGSMLLADFLKNTANRTPNKCALIFDNLEFTYEGLDRVTDQIARSLLKIGVERGDRVALFLKNCPELVFIYYACFKIGAIAVPLNSRYKGPELEYAARHCGAKILVVHDELFSEYASVRKNLETIEKCYLVGINNNFGNINDFSDLLEETNGDTLLPKIEENDPAVILYTSGTTAKPKGVVHTHYSLMHTVINQATTLQIDSSDISLVPLPICHIFGFGCLITTTYIGGTVILLPRFEPGSFLDAIDKYHPTVTTLLPPGLDDILNHPKALTCDFSSLKSCFVGGDKVPMRLHRRSLEIAGIEVIEGCGMTECCPYTVNPPFGPKRPGSIGTPVYATSLRLVDNSGKDVPKDDIGEILVKSEANMVGYWNNKEETAKALKDGWLYTGDMARVDGDGYYWFVCRKKEIIIRGGSNISPLEVEEVFYEHPAVKAVGVVGLPDEHLGQIVKAYVSLKEDVAHLPTNNELRTFVASRIAAYKVPEKIEFLSDLPLNPTGKVDRNRLKRLLDTRITN
jgi:acyl-CoA synthetase (AMP-forming)/AMP-acid ligase II